MTYDIDRLTTSSLNDLLFQSCPLILLLDVIEDVTKHNFTDASTSIAEFKVKMTQVRILLAV